MKFDRVVIIAVLLLCFFVPESLALTVNTEKIDYVIGDTINVDGTAGSGTDSVTISVYNSTDNLISSSVVNTTGGTTNYFSCSIQINSNYTPGDYYLSIYDGTGTVTSAFSVLSEFVFLKAHLIANPSVKTVNTPSLVTGVNNYSSDFSDIFNLSISGTLHYGNISDLTGDGKNYSFVLVDEKAIGVYDMLYIDKNGNFTGIWKARHVGEKISADVNYTIADIEFSTGNKILLAPPIEDDSYSAGETVHLLVWAKNETHMKAGTDVNISVVDKNDNIRNATTGQTNSDGYLVTNFTAPTDVGVYFVKVNGMPAEVFTVETFKLVGKVTDLSGNPMFSFSENPKLKIVAKVKDASGNLIDIASVSAEILSPGGSTVSQGTLAFDNNTNDYVKEVDLSSVSANGEYKVIITAEHNSNIQEFVTSFAIESVKLDVMAINPLFIEDAEGPEAMVDAFAPGANISLMVMLSNASSGNIMECGPEEMGLIDIDNKSTAVDECNTSVTLVSLRDEKGTELNLSTLNYKIMNLSRAVQFLGVEGDEGPGDEMLSQCMIIFEAPNETGVYKAEVKLKHPAAEKKAVSTFTLQRVYATANPVDFKGDDFWFYAPNSSIKIKIKVTDLLTRGDVPGENITDAKIIEMYKVWPAFADVLDNESYNPNASAANGTITFTSPDSEGFFMFKFKFKADVGGTEEHGTGSGFFMLKKYMIWGEPSGCEPGQACITAHSEPINLVINVVDIEKGSMMDLGKSGLSCSDNDNDGLPDCDGLEVNVDEIWNEQLMKKMESGTNYNVNTTSIRSSTANLTISPLDMPTGWYHVDLVLTDPVTGDTYFGWAWFEIRNFWVDVMTIETDDEGNLSAGWERGNTYGVGDSVLFTAMAFDPKNKTDHGPKLLEISTVSLESLSMMRHNGPPVTLENNTDYTYTQNDKDVSMPWGGPEGGIIEEMQVINLTLLVNKTGEYMANIRITTTEGDSDIGDMWFDVSKFRVEMTHNGGEEEWCTTFSPTQVVEINITASDFDKKPVNLTENATKIRTFWSEKSMHPIRPPTNSTTVTCAGNKCTLTANLSMILQGKGKYDLEMDIVDVNGNKKQSSIFFETRGIIVSIPNIKEIWFDEQDTNKRELDINNDRDRCDNGRGLDWDQYSGDGSIVKHLDPENSHGAGGLQPDECPGNTTTVCIYGSQTNFTNLASKEGNFRANIYCLLNNGTLTNFNFCGPSNGSKIGLLTNETYIWINDSVSNPANIIMSGIPARANDDTFTVGARNWTIVHVFVGDENGNRTEYKDDKIVRSCGGGCIDLIVSPKNTSLTYWVNPFCVNDTWPDGTQLGCSGNQQQAFVVSDTTHIWVSNTTNMTLSVPKTDSEALSGFIGSGNWRVLDVGRNTDGSYNDNAVRIVPSWTYYVINIFNTPPINVSRKYTQNFGRAFCIRPGGEWNDGDGTCEPEETPAFVVSNTSHLWINASNDLTESSALAVDSEFEMNGATWTIVSVSEQQFRVKRTSGICGEKECNQDGCVGYVLTPPTNSENYTTVYHGYVRNLIENLQHENWWFAEHFPAFNYTRDVYVYHNTTHVWISNSTNLSLEPAHAVNDIFEDPYGGKWKLDSINRNKVVLRGQNVLASTGAFINTSLSKSGVIKITAMEEKWLGGWDRDSGEEIGIDLDGDGQTNSSVYFALTDSQTAGVYDTLFYSNTSNFSTAIPVNGNRSERTFGAGENLTLLSIFPSARKVLAYGQKTGDWNDLGELKVGTTVKIPIIVRKPSGEYTDANVSVEIARSKTGQKNETVGITGTINGIGELEVDLADVFGSATNGIYTFGLAAESEDSEKELMEEWMWPFITMRSFLADAHIGDGGYISGFKQLPLTNYKEHNYGWIPELYTINDSGRPIIFGVLLHADDTVECTVTPPTDADGGNFSVKKAWPPFDGQYYYGIDATNQTIYLNPQTDCNFTHGDETGPLNLYDSVNLAFNSKVYALKVLEIQTSQKYNRTSLGISNVDPAQMNPLKVCEWSPENNPSPRWRLMSLNLSGQLYNVLLANDTTEEYPMCSVWNCDECAKKAWFSTDGNFSDAIGASIGDNFTSDLYLARIGPGPWEGISIGNFSDLGSLNLQAWPGIDVEAMDGTSSLFASVNESVINLDFNQNNQRNDTFYMVISDDRYDEVNDLTTVTVDDDLEITQEWWQKDESCYDFYGDESEAIRESRGDLPNSIWSGNVRFGEEINDTNPNWQIETFDGTSMLLRKHRDWNNPFNISDNVTIVLRAYNFNQSAVGGANLSVERVMSFGFMGGSILTQGSEYGISITNDNKTYDDGYAIVTLYPIGSDWDKGEYMVQVNIKDGSVTERKTEWFRIGDKMF